MTEAYMLAFAGFVLVETVFLVVVLAMVFLT